MYQQASIFQRDFLGAPSTHRGTITPKPGERMSAMSGTDFANHPVMDLRCGGNSIADGPGWTLRIVNPRVDFLGAHQIKVTGFAAPMAEDGTSTENTHLLSTEVTLNLG